jgi:protein FAM32A
MFTESERRYREVMLQRQKERLQKRACKGLREKVEEFNAKLSQLPEHFDIPKVGPG